MKLLNVFFIFTLAGVSFQSMASEDLAKAKKLSHLSCRQQPVRRSGVQGCRSQVQGR